MTSVRMGDALPISRLYQVTLTPTSQVGFTNKGIHYYPLFFTIKWINLWKWSFLVLNSILIFIPIGWFSLIYSYELMPTGWFFIRYLTQIIFTYWIVHVFGIPKYIEKYFKNIDVNEKNFSSSTARIVDVGMLTEADQTPIHDSNKTHKEVRSNKWYFEIGYQQSFSIAVFALTFVLAWIIPLTLPIGWLFFFLKYYIDKYNMVFGYRIEYEADAYIRRIVWTFSIFSIAFYQFVMGWVFLITGDDDMIILAFLLFLFSIFSVYFFTSSDAWKGKTSRLTKKFKEETDDYEDKSDSNGSHSKSFDLKLNKRKSSSNFGSTYRPEKFNIEGMTPPSASPFVAQVFNNIKTDAYLHPCAKKFSTEEVYFNKENTFRSFARFSSNKSNKINDTTNQSNSSIEKPSKRPTKFTGIEDFLRGRGLFIYLFLTKTNRNYT